MNSETTRPTLVFTGPEHSARVVRERLGDMFDVHAVDATPESLLPKFRQCTAFLDASMKVPLTATDIDAAGQLKLIVTATTGATHIDQVALAARNIPLLTLKGQREVLRELTPAAELSWALVMACARRLRGALAHVRDGGWERVEFPGLMLKGRTIGIIGMGRIGGWMARYAHAFGMRVVYFDPNNEDAPEYAQAVTLTELVGQSDVVSIHVHVGDRTLGMIDRDLIAQFKSGSIFVNTSRGELTDEAALVEALANGHLAAVGVDVLTDEPNIRDNVLWQYAQSHDNVVITPHIGGFCPDAVDFVVGYSCDRIRDWFNAA